MAWRIGKISIQNKFIHRYTTSLHTPTPTASTPFSFSSSVVHHLPQQPSYSKYRPRYNPMLICSYHSSSSSTLHEDKLPTIKLLLNSSQKREFLENFKIFHKLPSGSMLMIHVMEQQEKYMKVQFVAECRAHEIAKRAIFVSKAYEEDFACFMKIDLIEGPPLPNAVTLIAFHARDTDELGGELENEHIAGTIEVKFNWSRDEVSPLTPSPPRNLCKLFSSQEVPNRGGHWLAFSEGK